MPDESRGAPLRGLRVLELGADVSVRFAGWWLAECGANVSFFRPNWERPASAEAAAPFERQIEQGKRAADLESDAPYEIVLGDEAALDELDTQIPVRLTETASTIEVRSPLPSGTDFVETVMSDMVLWARSGLGYLTREVGPGGESGAPCLPLTRQASLLAGVAVALGAASAAIERTTSDVPRRIALDKLELLALLPMQPMALTQISNRIVGRDQGASSPGGIIASSDGMAYVRPVEPAHWASLFRLIDGLEWAAEEIEQNPGLLRESSEELDARIRAWAREQTGEELVEVCQAAHVPAAPISRPDQVVADPHLDARDFFRRSRGDAGVLLPWLARTGDATASAGRQPAGEPVRPPTSGLPLAGLRVLDLTWAWAGPFATTMLADLGAEVINVEWHPRASNIRRNAPYALDRDDSPNTAAWWSANQRGKHSVGVYMKDEAGRQVIKDLAARSDVVVENFSPGVVDRLGVGFDDLLEANLRLVYVSLSAFGQTGPHSHYVGYGTQIHAASGTAYGTSQDGETFSQMLIPYPDPVSGLVGAFAIAAYVYQARTTGLTAAVDLSELEAMSCVAMEPLLAALGGESEAPNATASGGTVSYVVASTADDQFVALIARQDEEWPTFQRVLSATDASAAALRDASKGLEAERLVALVAEAGLTATVIQDSGQCLLDPALTASGFWVRDESPEVVDAEIQMGGAIWQVDGERAAIWRGAPPLFSDTRAVLERVLEYEPAAVDALFAAGAVE